MEFWSVCHQTFQVDVNSLESCLSIFNQPGLFVDLQAEVEVNSVLHLDRGGTVPINLNSY